MASNVNNNNKGFVERKRLDARSIPPLISSVDDITKSFAPNSTTPAISPIDKKRLKKFNKRARDREKKNGEKSSQPQPSPQVNNAALAASASATEASKNSNNQNPSSNNQQISQPPVLAPSRSDQKQVTVSLKVDDKALSVITPAVSASKNVSEEGQNTAVFLREKEEKAKSENRNRQAALNVLNNQQTSQPPVEAQTASVQKQNEQANAPLFVNAVIDKTFAAITPAMDARTVFEQEQHKALLKQDAKNVTASNSQQTLDASILEDDKISKEEANKLLVKLLKPIFEVEYTPGLAPYVTLEKEHWITILNSADVNQWFVAIIRADTPEFINDLLNPLCKCLKDHPELQPKILRFLELLAVNREGLFRYLYTMLFTMLHKNQTLLEIILQSPYLERFISIIDNPEPLIDSLLELPNGADILSKLNIGQSFKNKALNIIANRKALYKQLFSLDTSISSNEDKIESSLFKRTTYDSALKYKTVQYWLSELNLFLSILTIKCNENCKINIQNYKKDCEETLAILEKHKDREVSFEMCKLLRAKTFNYYLSYSDGIRNYSYFEKLLGYLSNWKTESFVN